MREWVAFGVLLLLGWILRKLVLSIYLRLKERIDRAVPDHLPMGGGPWLEKQIPEGVRIVIASHADEHGDAFVPGANVIILSREVYRKHDASFWAVAAHELGHAIVYRASRLFHAVLLAGRSTVAVAPVFGSAMVFANVLYARPEINAIAFKLFEASLAGYVLVLIDELLASIIGVRILARDPDVKRRDMVGAVTRLLAAFMTYVAGFVGQVVLVLQRDFIVTQIEHHRHFVPGERMGATRMTFVILLAVILVGWSLVNLRRALFPSRHATIGDVGSTFLWTMAHEVGRGTIGAVLVWLVWDQPYGELMPLLCVAALVASRGILGLLGAIIGGIIRVIALLPAALVWFCGAMIAGLFFGWSPKDEPQPLPKPPDSERTKKALDDLEVERWNQRTIYGTLVGALNPALHLVFVVGLFVQILRTR